MKSFEINVKSTQVFFLHGLRGHGRSQQAALTHMAKNMGISLISLELDGHGADSLERHCLVPAYEKIVDDIIDEVKRRAIEADQIILMGYSFGAALMILAARELEQDQAFSPRLAALVGVSTAFDVGHNVPRWQLALSKAIAPTSRFMFEKAWRLSRLLTIREMDVRRISPDRTVQRAISMDPLIYKGRIPLATSAQVYRASVAAKKALSKIQTSTLLLHSKDDTIALAPQKESMPNHARLLLFKRLRHNCIDGISREVVKARKHIMQFIVNKL